MTDITQQALEAAHAHILDAYRTWQADDISTVPPSGSSAGKALALISAALSRPIDPKAEVVAVAWVIPGDDNARPNGFIDAMAWREGEFTRPLFASPSIVAPVGVGDGLLSLIPDEIEVPPVTERGIAGQVLDVAWPLCGGNHQDADFWNIFSFAVNLTLKIAALTSAEKAGVGDGDDQSALNVAERIIRQARAVISEEKKHRQRGERGENTTRDEVDFEYSCLVGDFTVADCDNALCVVKRRRAHVKQWKPLTGDLIGLLTQIDNMTTGTIETIDRMRKALEKISSPTQTTDLLWWQIEARAALAAQGDDAQEGTR